MGLLSMKKNRRKDGTNEEVKDAFSSLFQQTKISILVYFMLDSGVWLMSTGERETEGRSRVYL